MKISDLSRVYSKNYIRFLVEKDISLSSKDAYNLFRCVMCKLYGFRYEYESKLIKKYFVDCYNLLNTVKSIYKVDNDVDKKSIIECSCVYSLVLIQYCAGNIRVRDVGLDVLCE